MKEPAAILEKVIEAATEDTPVPSQPCKDQCSQHPYFAATLAKIDKRTRLTLWIALALLAQALGWQVIPRIVPAAEAAASWLTP
jgi:hypothetical protein